MGQKEKAVKRYRVIYQLPDDRVSSTVLREYRKKDAKERFRQICRDVHLDAEIIAVKRDKSFKG